MARKSTIKLLLINESDNEGERLISVFRNAGRVARAERAASLEALRNLLEKDAWDLLIANDKHAEITIEQALDQFKKSKAAIPFIAITDSEAVALMEAGATDVVTGDNDQRLVLIALRELTHLDNTRELAQVKDKLNDAEERSLQLMAQSQDAIAYVADGMLISCNDLFANRFGHEQADELDCAPVIDLIDKADQEKFKGLLKSQLVSGEGSTDFSFTGITHNGDSFHAAMQLSNAVIDDEPCIQLSVRDPGSASSNSGGSPDRDSLTDLYSPSYLIAQVDSATKQAAAGTGGSALLFISIDQFFELRSRYGLNCSNEIIFNLARALSSKCNDRGCLARYCDDGFGLLLEDTDADQAKAMAEILNKTIQQLSIELDGQSVRCTASTGVVLIDGKQETTAQTVIENGFATAEQIRSTSEGNGVAVFVPAREKKSLGDAANDGDLDKVLEEALEEAKFILVFQPVVSLRGTSGDHYEVQTRMVNDDGSEIEAIDFMHSLHFNAINTRLDRWILLEATKLMAAQIDAGHDTRLFINLTANALCDESLITWFGVALKAGGIPAQSITFQFLETDVLKFMKSAKTFSKSIKDLGCNIAISAFGNSDDPINTLKQFGANYVKIADKYTADLLGGGDTQMLKAMVGSINENECQAIISGVENAAALAQLWQLGVDYIQGRYLAGPSRQMDYEFTDIA